MIVAFFIENWVWFLCFILRIKHSHMQYILTSVIDLTSTTKSIIKNSAAHMLINFATLISPL